MYDRYDADYLAVKDNMTSELSAMSKEIDAAMEGYISDMAHWKNTAATDMENDPAAPGAAQSLLGKFQTTLRIIFDKMRNIIETLFQKLKNFVNKMILTDKGYKTMIRHAEVDRKPLKAVRIIMCDYDMDTLVNIFARFNALMDNIININGPAIDVLKRKDNILALPTDQMERAVLDKMELSELDSFDQMMIWIRKQFHGKKIEKTILVAELPVWLKRASRTDRVQQMVNSSIAPKKSRCDQMKNSFTSAASSPDLSSAMRADLTRMAANATKLYGKYAALATTFFDLYLEYVVAARVITKRFYQI